MRRYVVAAIAGGLAVIVLLSDRNEREQPVVVVPQAEASRERGRDPHAAPEREHPVRRASAPSPSPARLAVPGELRADPASAHVSGSPERARLRREAWDALTRFASDAELSEHQWNALLGDLADLAAVEREIGASPDQRAISPHDDLEVWETLGAELMSRASQYLTDAQVSKFRFRFHAPMLISQVRGLDLLDLPGPPG